MRSTVRSAVTGLVAALATTAGLLQGAPAAGAATVPSPGADLRGGFTGYAFDARCAPLDEQMDTWWVSSPFAAVGIYLGGALASCGSGPTSEQPHLDAAWVADQVATGWRLLPIWVGPQASCSTTYSVRIDGTPGGGGPGDYPAAAQQGRDEAAAAVARARELGIGRGSTLWFDLEGGFEVSDGDCRRSALRFLSSWTQEVRDLGYRSGVYSSISAGIAMLDHADAVSRGSYTMPDSVWFAWENGQADVDFGGDQWGIRARSWSGERVHQFDLDSVHEHGGLALPIDRNVLEVGGGTQRPPVVRRCGGVDLAVPDGTTLRTGSRGARVEALQCLLRGPGRYTGRLDGRFDRDVLRALRRAQTAVGLPAARRVGASTWVALQAAGDAPLLKQGLASDAVRRVQRALVHATAASDLRATGIVDANTDLWVRAYQEAVGRDVTGVVDAATWDALRSGVLQAP